MASFVFAKRLLRRYAFPSASSFSTTAAPHSLSEIPVSLTLFSSSSSSSGHSRLFLLGSSSAFLSALFLSFNSSPDQPSLSQPSPLPPSPPPLPSSAFSSPPPFNSRFPLGGPLVSKSGRAISKLKIFVGYDQREDLAYEVCRHSLLKHSTLPIEVIPIKQSELRRNGLYTRERDPTESTEFSFTRFLTPYLAGFEGWAMFVDCDFLYTADIRELVELVDDRYAIMCVQHDYTPKTATKMDGVVQTTYPRKNWSSMVLYNCSHPKNRVLTPAVVNSQSGAFLHRFMWLDDKDIGAIPYTWNFLVGHNEMPKGSKELPKAIHYTSGGPWFEAWRSCEFADAWFQEKDEFQRSHMIRKVIQDELIQVLDSRMAERAAQLEEKVAEMDSRLKEVAALQKLLLFYMQEKMLPISERNGNGKELPMKLEDLNQLEERLARTKIYTKD